MGAFIRRAILSIAVLLGIADPAEPPILATQLHRTDSAVYAEAELREFPGEALVDLVKSGNRLTIALSVRTPARETVVRKTLAFDGSTYSIRDETTGDRRTTKSEAAAFILAGVFDGIVIPGLDPQGAFPVTLFCECWLELPDDPSYDPMILWGYRPAIAEVEIESIGEIPF